MLITEAYRGVNAAQHAAHKDWGCQSVKYAGDVRELCERLNVTTFLDYGCGKRTLGRAVAPFGITATNYDPAFPEFAASPEPHDLVVCTDVLEHVEPDCLDDVLKDLRRVTKRMAFLVVATKHSQRNLVDGTNPHKIVQPKEWWIEKLSGLFHVQEALNRQGHKYFSVIVRPR